MGERLVWDISLMRSGAADGRLQVNLPRVLAISLIEAGYTRATLSVTDDGLLLRPYRGEKRGRSNRSVELPEAWS